LAQLVSVTISSTVQIRLEIPAAVAGVTPGEALGVGRVESTVAEGAGGG